MMRQWLTRLSTASISPAVQFVSRFLRVIILSHLLSPDEFGTAVAITVFFSIGMQVSDISFDKFSIVNGKAESLAAVHLLSIIRGVIVGGLLALLGPWAAGLFGVPQFYWSFIAIGLVPFIASFANLGVKQVQRDYQYGADAIAVFVSQITALLALLAAVFTFRDHRVIVISFAVEQAVYVLMTHVLSTVPYSLKPSRPIFRSALAYGTPLMANGVGLAISSQLDRAIVGHWFGVQTLALYSVTLSISLIPIGLIMQIFGMLSFSFMMNEHERRYRYDIVLFAFSLVAIAYAAFLGAGLDVLTPFIFGNIYQVDWSVVATLALIAFVRIQWNGGPTVYLLAAGKTTQLALINLSGFVGLFFGALFLTAYPRIESMLLGLLIGDLLKLVLMFGFSPAKASPVNMPGLTSSFVAALIIVLGVVWNVPPSWGGRFVVLGLGACGLLMQLSFTYRDWASPSGQLLHRLGLRRRLLDYLDGG